MVATPRKPPTFIYIVQFIIKRNFSPWQSVHGSFLKRLVRIWGPNLVWVVATPWKTTHLYLWNSVYYKIQLLSCKVYYTINCACTLIIKKVQCSKKKHETQITVSEGADEINKHVIKSFLLVVDNFQTYPGQNLFIKLVIKHVEEWLLGKEW